MADLLTPADFERRQKDHQRDTGASCDGVCSTEDAAPRELNPYAGLMRRVAALLGDFAVLYLAYHALIIPLRPVLRVIGGFDYLLGVAIFFAYFLACEGPLLGGRSIGKMLMKIRVVNRDFASPSWGQSAFRLLRFCFVPFLIKNLPLLTPRLFLDRTVEYVEPQISFILFSLQGIGLDEAQTQILSAMGLLIVVGLLKNAGIDFVFGNAFHIWQHPLKQGLHDRLAGTYVVQTMELERAREQREQWFNAKFERRTLLISSIIILTLFFSEIGSLWYARHQAAAQPHVDAQQEIDAVQQRIAKELPHTSATPVFNAFDVLLMLPERENSAPANENMKRSNPSFFNAMNPKVDEELRRIQKEIETLEQKQNTGGEELTEQETANLNNYTTAMAHLMRLRVIRLFYYHRRPLDETERAKLDELRDQALELCQERLRKGEYPFMQAADTVEDLPTSNVFVFEAIHTNNLFLATTWATDYISTKMLTIDDATTSVME
ncbi:RDD family protein [Candidatus Sumerlaeota bacterium]|nr:RDD family protein [Candidatus Sumerlaeota bacterium]